MAEVVRKRDRLGQILVQPEVARDGAGDLRNFQAVREPRAKQVALVI